MPKLTKTCQKNWFPCLAAALASENLDVCDFPPISYCQTVSITVQDGTKYGHYISIYRAESGSYERPIHYGRG